MQYDPSQKPDPKVCPRHFCFMWQMARPITPQTLEPVSVEEGCGCPFGLCTRLDPERGNKDWYSSHDPNLRAAGLPWFYFYPSPANLVPQVQEEYVRESEALWGEGHWRDE